MLLDGVQVHGSIAVVIPAGAVIVLVDWRDPDRGDAKILKIGQVLLDAAEVAAVIGARVGAIIGPGSRKVVLRIAVSEAVGHDEVDNIIRSKTVEALIFVCGRTGWISWIEPPLRGLFSLGCRDQQRDLPRQRALGNL